MNDGKLFENDFKESVPKDTYYFRVKDPAQSFGEGQNNLRFSSPNPFDIILFHEDTMFALELKSTKGTAFSFKGSSPMIKENQIKELTKAAQFKGIIPGFIFNLRKESGNKTYFLHISDFNKLIASTTKSSINEKDIIDSGAIEVRGEIKKVRYKYWVGEFILRMKDKEIT
jgi:recombination protein U